MVFLGRALVALLLWFPRVAGSPLALPNTVLVIFSAAALPCGQESYAFLPAESASQGHCQGLRLTLPGEVWAAPTAQGPQPKLEKQCVDAGIRGILEDL